MADIQPTKLFDNFTAIDFVEHLVSSTRIDIGGDTLDSCFAVAFNQILTPSSCCPTGSSLPAALYEASALPLRCAVAKGPASIVFSMNMRGWGKSKVRSVKL